MKNGFPLIVERQIVSEFEKLFMFIIKKSFENGVEFANTVLDNNNFISGINKGNILNTYINKYIKNSLVRNTKAIYRYTELFMVEDHNKKAKKKNLPFMSKTEEEPNFEDDINLHTNDLTDNMVNLKKEILDEALNIVVSNKDKKQAIKDMTKIKDVSFGKLKNELVFRVGKINKESSNKVLENNGILKYSWNTQRDNRVRDTHRELDRKVFSLDEPPIIRTNAREGEVRGEPGDDYNCRCYKTFVLD